MAWMRSEWGQARRASRVLLVGVAVVISLAACSGGSGGDTAVVSSAPYAKPVPPTANASPEDVKVAVVPSTTTTTIAPPPTTLPEPPAPSVVATATPPAEPPATTPTTAASQSACAVAVAYIAAHGAPGWSTVCGYHAGWDISACVAAARAIGGQLPYGCTDTYDLTSYIACPIFTVYANEAENQRYEANLGGRFDAYGEAPQCAWANPLGS